MKICPKCGSSQSDNWKYCTECGFLLSDSKTEDTDRNEESASSKKFSNNQNPVHGYSIQKQEKPSVNDQSEKKSSDKKKNQKSLRSEHSQKKLILPILTVCMAAAFLLSAGWLIYSRNTKAPEIEKTADSGVKAPDLISETESAVRDLNNDLEDRKELIRMQEAYTESMSEYSEKVNQLRDYIKNTNVDDMRFNDLHKDSSVYLGPKLPENTTDAVIYFQDGEIVNRNRIDEDRELLCYYPLSDITILFSKAGSDLRNGEIFEISGPGSNTVNLVSGHLKDGKYTGDFKLASLSVDPNQNTLGAYSGAVNENQRFEGPVRVLMEFRSEVYQPDTIRFNDGKIDVTGRNAINTNGQTLYYLVTTPEHFIEADPDKAHELYSPVP